MSKIKTPTETATVYRAIQVAPDELANLEDEMDERSYKRLHDSIAILVIAATEEVDA